jgi:hypothetical protein
MWTEGEIMKLTASIDIPFLQRAVELAGDPRVVLEQFDTGETVALQAHLWVHGTTDESFESGLAEDPTVARFDRVLSTADRRLYRVELERETAMVELYHSLVDTGSTIVDARTDTATRGWRVEFLLTDGDAFHDVRGEFRRHDVPVEVEGVTGSFDDETGFFDLTRTQYQTLVTAMENGYFDVPRSVSLDDVSEELGVSHQATSERMRRALRDLVRSTLREPEKWYP